MFVIRQISTFLRYKNHIFSQNVKKNRGTANITAPRLSYLRLKLFFSLFST